MNSQKIQPVCLLPVCGSFEGIVRHFRRCKPPFLTCSLEVGEYKFLVWTSVVVLLSRSGVRPVGTGKNPLHPELVDEKRARDIATKLSARKTQKFAASQLTHLTHLNMATGSIYVGVVFSVAHAPHNEDHIVACKRTPDCPPNKQWRQRTSCSSHPWTPNSRVASASGPFGSSRTRLTRTSTTSVRSNWHPTEPTSRRNCSKCRPGCRWPRKQKERFSRGGGSKENNQGSKTK